MSWTFNILFTPVITVMTDKVIKLIGIFLRYCLVDSSELSADIKRTYCTIGVSPWAILLADYSSPIISVEPTGRPFLAIPLLSHLAAITIVKTLATYKIAVSMSCRASVGRSAQLSYTAAKASQDQLTSPSS